MKKLLTMFALGTSMMFASCGHNVKSNENANSQVLQLNPTNSRTAPPCIVEVPCNEPELTISGHERLRKFYDFCDSTVTVTWSSTESGYTYAVYNHETRSITDLHGSEKAEKDAAYKKYQASLGLGK